MMWRSRVRAQPRTGRSKAVVAAGGVLASAACSSAHPVCACRVAHVPTQRMGCTVKHVPGYPGVVFGTQTTVVGDSYDTTDDDRKARAMLTNIMSVGLLVSLAVISHAPVVCLASRCFGWGKRASNEIKLRLVWRTLLSHLRYVSSVSEPCCFRAGSSNHP